MKPWKRARSTPPPGEPLSPPGLVWLLVTLTLAVLLHAGQVPIWLVLGFLALAGWRAAIVWYSWSLPAPCCLLRLPRGAAAPRLRFLQRLATLHAASASHASQDDVSSRRTLRPTRRQTRTRTIDQSPIRPLTQRAKTLLMRSSTPWSAKRRSETATATLPMAARRTRKTAASTAAAAVRHV
jgi:hypothetical protein